MNRCQVESQIAREAQPEDLRGRRLGVGAGYFNDEDYYCLNAEDPRNEQKLQRGQQNCSQRRTVRGADQRH